MEILEEHGHFREDVLAEKDELRAGPPRRPERQQAHDRRIGERDDDVGLLHGQRRHRGRQKIADVVERAAREAPRSKARAVRAKNPDAVVRLAADKAPPWHAAASPGGRRQRPSGHHRHLAAVGRDEIFGELGQQLTGGRDIRPIRAIEETDFQTADFWV